MKFCLFLFTSQNGKKKIGGSYLEGFVRVSGMSHLPQNVPQRESRNIKIQKLYLLNRKRLRGCTVTYCYTIPYSTN